MVKLTVFGENLLYRMGGAERSTYLLVERLAASPDVEITVVSGKSARRDATCGRYAYGRLVTLPTVRLRHRLPFLQFVLSSRSVSPYFRTCDADLLFANAEAAPMAVNGFRGPSVYFIHDEMSLNVYRTYEKRAVKRLKFAARCVFDAPFMAYYRAQNRRAMRKSALVVANSEYMARRAKERFGVDAVVVYPQVDVEKLKRIELPPPSERPYVMMVGDQQVKGADTFHRIAQAMPDLDFLAVGRSYVERRDGNLVLRGFEADPLTHYRTAKLVVLPSTWEEGFGMVSVEAQALGIPALVSDRGGLPETVPSQNEVVADYRNPEAWVAAIRGVLADYDERSRAGQEYVSRFDGRAQMETLIEAVREATGISLS